MHWHGYHAYAWSGSSALALHLKHQSLSVAVSQWNTDGLDPFSSNFASALRQETGNRVSKASETRAQAIQIRAIVA